MAHQMWREPKSAAIDILGRLDVDPKEVADLYDPQFLEAVTKLEFPENVTRSPFMELTNACPEDQALAYQPAVMKELAKQAYEMDHSFQTPQSTLLVNVVKPETEPYQCGVGWPFQDVKVAKASTDQYYRADLRQRSQRIVHEDTPSGLRAEEGVMAGASAATSSGLRAEEGRTGRPVQHVEVPTPSGLRAEGEPENEETHGDSDVVFETELDNLATARTEEHQEMEVDQGASPKATSDADQSDMTPMEYGGLAITASAAGIRQSREYTFALIQHQEYMLSQWTRRRDLVEAGFGGYSPVCSCDVIDN
eukprot:4743914-Amphidinium_carterae.1